eukprot:scaffold3272_cov239-Pinguiococcus_pyrenoidosus.AAC.7
MTATSASSSPAKAASAIASTCTQNLSAVRPIGVAQNSSSSPAPGTYDQLRLPTFAASASTRLGRDTLTQTMGVNARLAGSAAGRKRSAKGSSALTQTQRRGFWSFPKRQSRTALRPSSPSASTKASTR